VIDFDKTGIHHRDLTSPDNLDNLPQGKNPPGTIQKLRSSENVGCAGNQERKKTGLYSKMIENEDLQLK